MPKAFCFKLRTLMWAVTIASLSLWWARSSIDSIVRFPPQHFEQIWMNLNFGGEIEAKDLPEFHEELMADIARVRRMHFARIIMALVAIPITTAVLALLGRMSNRLKGRRELAAVHPTTSDVVR